MPWSLLVRDAVIVLSTLGAWALDAAVRAEGGVTAGLVALLAGAMTALCGYLAHEWGHFVGARLSHSAVHLPPSARSLFLFRFDVRCNDFSNLLGELPNFDIDTGTDINVGLSVVIFHQELTRVG